MKELVDAMTDEDPAKRPNIEDVILRFSRIRDSLSGFKLRSLITSKKDPSLITASRHIRQVFRTAQYVVMKKVTVPLA
jgi:hypothetical protein